MNTYEAGKILVNAKKALMGKILNDLAADSERRKGDNRTERE